MNDYKMSNWIERITKYEDLREEKEYWKNEKERVDDNIIKRLIDICNRLDKLEEQNDRNSKRNTNGNEIKRTQRRKSKKVCND